MAKRRGRKVLNGWHMTWQWREAVSHGSDQCTQETRITHDADVGLHSEIGRIGSWHSFLRAMHVPSLHLDTLYMPCIGSGVAGSGENHSTTTPEIDWDELEE